MKFVLCALGAAALGAVAITPEAVQAPRPPVGIHLTDIQLTSGAEDDAQDIVIDFVRHAQTNPSGSTVEVASNGLPGFPLSATGEEQAKAVGEALTQQFGPHVAGVFGGYEQRMIETATPFLDDDHLGVQAFQTLNGFDEIGGGIYADDPPASLGAYLSELTGLLWVFGLPLVPIPGSNDYIGTQFDENFGGAVDTAYQDALAHPVISTNGHITDVVFSGEGAISAWTLMNVDNPDLAILLPAAFGAASNGELLGNAGQVVIEGNPTDGWTLVSFGGQAIPQDPGLLTQLVVDARDLDTAPQTALWNLFEAVLTGDSATIGSALEAGVQSVGAQLVAFPESVIHDIGTAVQTLGGDVEAGQSFSDAFDSAILGLPA